MGSFDYITQYVTSIDLAADTIGTLLNFVGGLFGSSAN